MVKVEHTALALTNPFVVAVTPPVVDHILVETFQIAIFDAAGSGCIPSFTLVKTPPTYNNLSTLSYANTLQAAFNPLVAALDPPNVDQDFVLLFHEATY